MFAASSNHQIGDTVVDFVAIDVMHLLGGKELSPKVLLHNVPMLKYPVTLNRDHFVTGSSNRSTSICAVASTHSGGIVTCSATINLSASSLFEIGAAC